jgi:hypothetical protein
MAEQGSKPNHAWDTRIYSHGAVVRTTKHHFLERRTEEFDRLDLNPPLRTRPIVTPADAQRERLTAAFGFGQKDEASPFRSSQAQATFVRVAAFARPQTAVVITRSVIPSGVDSVNKPISAAESKIVLELTAGNSIKGIGGRVAHSEVARA